MFRRLVPLTLVLAVLAAACAEAPVEPEFGTGSEFTAAVVDPLNDAGLYPSVAVVDGRPVVAYFAFAEVVEEGSFPQTRPIGSPTIPGVMLATVRDGIWTRGAIAIEKQINNVQVAFNPAFVESVGAMTPQSVTGLQLVADADGGLHAVWGDSAGVFYATGTADPASMTQWTVEQVTSTPGLGPSLALDADGNPWIAYHTSTSTIAALEIATPDGNGWATESIDDAPGCSGCRTAIAVNGDGVPVVAWGDGANVNAAALESGAWSRATVERGGVGTGLAAAATPDGGIVLTYDTGVQVHAATGTGTEPFEVATVAELGEGDALPAARTTGVAVDDQGAVTATWLDPAAGAVRMATSSDGTTFTPVETGQQTVGGAMPAAGVAADGATSFVAWYETEPQDLMLGGYGDLGELAIAVPSPTPTQVVQPSSAPPSQECTPVVDGKVTVVAEGIAFTDGACIEAPAGEPFTILFDNRDSGTQHNIQVFGGPEVSGAPTFQGDLVTGPAQIEYEIPALDAGEYAYNCLVHPTMVGTIKVVEGGGGAGPTGPTSPTGPTGASGPTGATGASGATGSHGGHGDVTTTVVAEGIAFDTSTIALPADTESVLTFENRDSAVQHNIAIYTDSSMTEELFFGELVTGPATVEYTIPPLPAGEYYFVCIIHPNMNGTVVVQ